MLHERIKHCLTLAVGTTMLLNLACDRDNMSDDANKLKTDVPKSLSVASPVVGTSNPMDEPFFIDVSDSAGIHFIHAEIPDLAIPQGAGVVALDFNNDGEIDIFVANSAGPNSLYRNNGDGTFTDVAESSGVSDPDGRGNGGCSADYDNDGNVDLYLTNYGKSRLFLNHGNDMFSEVSANAGVGEKYSGFRSTGCAWGDYDNDGYADLVIVRHLFEHRPDILDDPNYMVGGLGGHLLYHNNGDGSFTKVSHLLGDTTPPVEGVAGIDEVTVGNLWGAGFQPGWFDYDNDGDVDLYIVNDFGRFLHSNVLWRNDGLGIDGTWTFTDISMGSGADVQIFGMSMAVGDYNQDGFFDVFITDIRGNVLLRNDGNGRTFTDLATEAGVNTKMIGRRVRVSWGAFFFDYDNDTDLDLYIVSGFLGGGKVAGNPLEQPNLLMNNDSGGMFKDVSWMSGADDKGIGRGGVYLDYDNDGCLDIFIANLGQRARLFRNRCNWDNNWITVNVVGTKSNRDGLGARLELISGKDDPVQIREIATGRTHMGQNTTAAHFGLGSSTVVKSLLIRWPSGVIQQLKNIPSNQRITIKEPSSN